MLPGSSASFPIPVGNLYDDDEDNDDNDDDDDEYRNNDDDDDTCQLEGSCIVGRTPGSLHVCTEHAPANLEWKSEKWNNCKVKGRKSESRCENSHSEQCEKWRDHVCTEHAPSNLKWKQWKLNVKQLQSEWKEKWKYMWKSESEQCGK